MKRSSIPGQLLRLLHLLIVPITYFVTKAAAKHPKAVEWLYSARIYPVISGAVSHVTRLVPFAVVEILAFALAVAFVVSFIVRLIKLFKKKEHAFARFLSLFISALIFAAYLFPAFYVMWGFNMFRLPIDEKMKLPEREYTVEELNAVCADLAQKASSLREKATVDTSGYFSADLDKTLGSVREACDSYGRNHPDFKADCPEANPLISSEFFSKCGISGIYIFLTEEPCINKNEPFLYTPHSAAHETAHYIGYAHEDDANFLAFLICSEAEDPNVAYSGYMHALVHCGNALSKADKEAYARLYGMYSEGMVADLKQYSEHYRKYSDTKTWEKSNELNDNYLKFNQQEKGVLSYQEDTALILRYYDSIGFFN